MSKEIMSYIDYPMVKVPGGEIDLRDDRIKRKWKAEIRPFLLARYPVTADFYYTITNKSPNSFDRDLKPVVNISWYDAISFCNLLSQKPDWESLILLMVKKFFSFYIRITEYSNYEHNEKKPRTSSRFKGMVI